jgi:hypothetical protein
MTAPDQCCINVKKLLSIRRRPHMTQSGHEPGRNPAVQHSTEIQNNSGRPQGLGSPSAAG